MVNLLGWTLARNSWRRTVDHHEELDMGGTSRFARLMLAAVLAATGAVAAGAAQAGADERIVGGSRVKIEDYAYAVYLSTKDGFQYCGGTLVSADKVVTAAHCSAGKDTSEIIVVGGREDKESTEGMESRVRSIWVHPDFTDIRSGADISVLTLASPMPYDTAALATPDDGPLYRPGVVGVILGWGRTAADGAVSQHLRKASVPLVSDTGCQRAYPSFLPESMVCAGLAQGGIDTCQGDSGGPLTVSGVLVGVTSWGEGCAEPNRPGVYTRVAGYSDELHDQI